MKLGTAEESALTQTAIAETTFQHQIGINNDVIHGEQERGDPMQHLKHLQNEIFLPYEYRECVIEWQQRN